MKDSPSARPPDHHHNRWLVLIAVYKLLQAMLFVAIGVGALHLLHKDVGDMFAVLADRLRFNPESRIVNFILDKASLIDDPLLRRIGAVAFCYAAVGLAEGIGLYLEKAWGEILTVVITASFLPWELVEAIHRITWERVSLLVINILVFLYLLDLINQQRRQRHHRKKSSPERQQKEQEPSAQSKEQGPSGP